MAVSPTAPMPNGQIERTPNTDVGQARNVTAFANGNDSPSFWDFLDVINPLQHIPIVNGIYRHITGDEIGAGAKIAGGVLFGGVIGLGAAVVNLLVEENSGKDIGGHVMTAFGGGKDDAQEAPATQLAETGAQPAEDMLMDLPQADVAVGQPMIMTPSAEESVPNERMPPIPGPIATPGLFAMMQNADEPAPRAAPQPEAGPAKLAVAQEPALLRPVHEARFMPVPERIGRAEPRPVPPAPTYGQPHLNRQPFVDPVAIERAMAAQGLSDANHPLLNVAAPAVQPAAAAVQEQVQEQGDWFTNNMIQALERYDSSRRGRNDDSANP
ncbi:hypothetical protein [Telmatospirillum sp. J64-1]|uniref:hypothetical protein n=1 Tax=Telmatospirillum sp. J64-1 TaxID=2502183 RepID=UPI00115DB6D4|nr:hypothetical protein [Telmatospirillum sp. J64-1]